MLKEIKLKECLCIEEPYIQEYLKNTLETIKTIANDEDNNKDFYYSNGGDIIINLIMNSIKFIISNLKSHDRSFNFITDYVVSVAEAENGNIVILIFDFKPDEKTHNLFKKNNKFYIEIKD